MIGFSIGLFVGIILHVFNLNSYKGILKMKAEDGSAEYIKGKFYYITEERIDK